MAETNTNDAQPSEEDERTGLNVPPAVAAQGKRKGAKLTADPSPSSSPRERYIEAQPSERRDTCAVRLY